MQSKRKEVKASGDKQVKAAEKGKPQKDEKKSKGDEGGKEEDKIDDDKAEGAKKLKRPGKMKGLRKSSRVKRTRVKQMARKLVTKRCTISLNAAADAVLNPIDLLLSVARCILYGVLTWLPMMYTSRASVILVAQCPQAELHAGRCGVTELQRTLSAYHLLALTPFSCSPSLVLQSIPLRCACEAEIFTARQTA